MKNLLRNKLNVKYNIIYFNKNITNNRYNILYIDMENKDEI